MTRQPCLLLLCCCLVHGGASRAAEDRAAVLRVAVRLDARSCFVGQDVGIAVRVIAGQEPPRFEAPALPFATIRHLGTEVSPLSMSGIGAAITTRTAYTSRYRLVPTRAGAWTIPRFRARIGDAKGTTSPVELRVKPTPAAGRPAGFLGGVGAFTVTAEVEPTSVQAGREFEYRLTIRGPGALGVTGPPDLSRLQRLPIGLRVTRRPDVVDEQRHVHAFVYRLRPMRAGEATLPPVRIAAFDPKAGVYVTRATAGLPVRVVDVPRFDASRLVLPVPPREESRSGRVWAIVAAVAVVAVIGVAWARRRFRQGRPARERSRRCRAAVARIRGARDAEAQGRAVAEGLADYLDAVIGRPPGALTPAEAREDVALATGSETLATRAETLIRRSDGARFGAVADMLGAEGIALFGDLERAGKERPTTRVPDLSRGRKSLL